MKRKSILGILVFYLCGLSIQLAAQTDYDVYWVDTIGIVIDTTQKSIAKGSINGWNNSGCNSYSILPDATPDGYFKFDINNDQLIKAIGFTAVQNPTDLDDLDYCFYFTGTSYYIYEYGNLVGLFGTYLPGDEFKLKKEQGDVKFYKNGTQFHSITIATAADYRVGAVFYDNGAEFDNVLIDFGQPRITVVNVAGASAFHLGSIELEVDGQFPPYTIEWDDWDHNIDSLLDSLNGAIPDTNSGLLDSVFYGINPLLRTELLSGFYDVSLIDANGAERHEQIVVNRITPYFMEDSILVDTLLSKFTGIGSPNPWRNMTHKIITNTTTDFAYAFKLDASTSVLTLGLRDTIDDPDDSLKNMKFGFHFTGTQIDIWDGTTYYTSLGTYGPTDLFEIKSDAGSLTFSKNGTTLKTASLAASTDYTLDASLKGNSAGSFSPVYAINNLDGPVHIDVDIKHSSCNGEDGCIYINGDDWFLNPSVDFPTASTYKIRYQWTDVESGTIISTQKDLCGVGIGKYELLISYDNGFMLTPLVWQTFEIGTRVMWDWTSAARGVVNKTNNDLWHTTGQVYRNYRPVISKNHIKTQEDGWVEFEFEMPNDGRNKFSLIAAREFNKQDKRLAEIIFYNRVSSSTAIMPTSIWYDTDFKNKPLGYTNPYTQRAEIIQTYPASLGASPVKKHKIRISRTYNGSSPLGYNIIVWLDGVPIIGKVYDNGGGANDYTADDAFLYLSADITNGGNRINDILTSFPCEQVDSYNVPENKLKGDYRDTYGETFYFKYDAEYNDGALKFRILKESDKSPILNIPTNYTINKTQKNFGDNRYAIDMSRLVDDKYILEVTNEKNETYYLRIRKEL
ncbi:MAG: hypothetical protein CL840_06445 [Crocinitomicaceae bacterium]|nr:hypothetical protein [Crocinitomicaceae bacterium]|tara:strand:+ start:2636 stop:5185 length:2550 start_codon:yes stop_codon:yes gene_type:complete